MAKPANSGIYEIVNRFNGKRYVGSSSNLAQRWYMHRWALDRGRHHSYRLQAAWVKHTDDWFEFRILEHCPADVLLEREQHHIDSLKPVYNVARHARGGGGVMSDDGRKRIAESNRRRTGWKQTDEAKARCAAAKIGNTHTKGQKRNPKAVAKTAAAHRGMKRSAETRQRISDAMRGKKRAPVTAETRAKLSAAFKGRQLSPERMAALQAGRKNRVYTDEQRAKIGATSRAAWERRKRGLTDGHKAE